MEETQADADDLRHWQLEQIGKTQNHCKKRCLERHAESGSLVVTDELLDCYKGCDDLYYESKNLIHGLSKHVQVCCANMDLLGPAKVPLGALGAQHCWIRTPNMAAGLYAAEEDQTGDGGLPASPCYGTRTVIWDHTGWEKYRPDCYELVGCNTACVESELQIGKKMGVWSASYQCKAFVKNVLFKCGCINEKIEGKWKWDRHTAVPEEGDTVECRLGTNE
jgi:hypothetical protein